MLHKKLIVTALSAGALFFGAMSSASAIYVVDFSPTATNNGSGAIGTAADFSAVGFQSDMAATLTISGSSGSNVAFSETGYINITSFQDAFNLPVASGVNSDYTLGATFSISGTGDWVSTTFTADPGATFNFNLYAGGSSTDPSTGTLIGTGSLDPTSLQLAFAIALGTLNPGDTGAGFTSLTAGLTFNPDPDYTGAGGFFQNINPPTLLLAVGNAGGNQFNTSYTVNGDGSIVSFIVPTSGANLGTANVTFDAKVPEPGVLALFGIGFIGLAGLGLSRKKNSLAA